MKKYFALNLQLFAEPNTNVTTDSGLSVENKIYYDMTLIDEASANLVHDQFGQKRDIPRGGGKTINFRKFAALPKALDAITEGVTPDGKKLTATKIEAAVEQYGDYVTLSDMLDMTSIDPIVVEATKVVGRQAGLTLDTITRNVIQGGKNVFYAPKADGSVVSSRTTLDNTCKLTVDVVKKAVAFLKKNNAPKINGYYVGIIHPYAAYDLMSDPEWKYPHQYKDTENLYNGEIGAICGVRFTETSEAKIYENGVFGTLIIGEGAYGVTEITGGGLETIIKQLGSAGSADPLNLAA
jgi:N4-gp56 family major capsid protein